MIQSLFIFNEAVLARTAPAPTMFYRNFVIENNHIEGVHPHGIFVGETSGLTIRGNTVVKDPDLDAPTSHGWEPIIEVATRSTGVTITGNTAHEICPARMPGWTISGNQLVPLELRPGQPHAVARAAPTPASPTSPTPSPTRHGQRAGTAGNDTLVGTAGSDTLRGYAGNDRLTGGAGRRRADRRHRGRHLRLRPRRAFGRELPRRAARRRRRQVLRRRRRRRRRPDRRLGHRRQRGRRRQPGLRLGGAGIGRISAVEMGNTATLVRANTDNDAAFEFELVIEDASTNASAYTAADFIL